MPYISRSKTLAGRVGAFGKSVGAFIGHHLTKATGRLWEATGAALNFMIRRRKPIAILLTAFVFCLCAVPNFFPEQTIRSWPKWAQRHLVLGLDLQGGSHILLEVDAAAVRKEKVEALRDDVRRVLREARVGLSSAPVVRGNSVEVTVRESDLQTALTKIRELSQPLGG